MANFPIQTYDQKAVLAVAFTFAILAFIAVCLRLIAHQIAHKKWMPSDYFIIAACIFAVGLQSISITGVFQAGIGYGHVLDVIQQYGPAPVIKLSQLIIPLQFTWVLSLSCTKISILCLYLHIFPYRWLAWSSYVTMAIIVAWTIGTILVGCLICQPFAFNWDKTIPDGKCGDQVTSFTITGIINLVTDVMVLLMPMQPVYQLQMATYKKLTLVAVFGLGVFTCVISALRISVLSSMDFADITFTIPKANIFSGLEPCIACVLACVPLMRPLLGHSVQTPYGSGERPAKSQSKSAGSKEPKGVRDDGFDQLDDDTSELCLRPLGLQHRADASALRETVNDDASEIDVESIDRDGGGIRVKQSFQVEERGRAL
ncbi:hypothetical protein HBI42_081120 [Parastagonospora nodorum]|nr:hypothetical protein HBI79_121240 [Parastagonospora nodorum]KAH6222748.1 hypothetical protein HBI43_086380 [Parastagonospora nodorum]KAH6261587.1 hypothetical protein HBI42_081120 [Parastagonospora nodorum]